ncbi:MAG: SDR family oxidoreductase [Phycisphaerae bacterium]|nr:SDR family oxidoreductase [Phycisphaerae bacterium]
MDLLLHNMPSLVFGGAGGIGARIARTLAEEGALVHIADRDKDAAARTASAIGRGVVGLGCNICDPEQVQAAVDQVVRECGGLKIAVQAVGLTLANYLPDITERDLDVTFDTNMRGTLYVAQAVVEPMKKAGYGRLVLIGSASGMKASAGLALYSASKFFLRGLAQAVGLEYGPSGITANIICPTDVYPEGDEPAQSWHDPTLVNISCRKEGVPDLEALKKKRIAANPMRRSCTAADVANLAAFLCSPLAGFLNAQTIGLTGGALTS